MTRFPAHGPLFPVSQHLAERYAAALKRVSNADLPLQDFSIDRLGWSPQLAALLGEDYLGREGMRYAIILSPDQGQAPALRARYSYELSLVKEVYLKARPTLLNIIETEALIVEFDNERAYTRQASDVLGIKRVQACLTTARDTLTKTQRLLDLAQGLTSQARLLDDRYIDQMLTLVKDVGDPRRRTLPPPLEETIGSLWAEILGAVYVLRPPAGQPGDTLVVATRPDRGLEQLPVRSFELDGPALIDELHAAGYLHYITEEAMLRKRMGELEREALLSAGIEPVAEEDAARRRQLAGSSAAQQALSEVHRDLESELKRRQAGLAFDPQRLSVPARWALSAPAQETEILIHLLGRFVRYDYRMLAYHHHRIMQAEWPRYSEAKRRYIEGMFPHLKQSFVPS